MRNPVPFTRQALIEAEIDGAQRGRMPAGLQAWSGPNSSDGLPATASGTDAHPPLPKPGGLPPPAASANGIAGNRSRSHPEAPCSGSGSPPPVGIASGDAAAPDAAPLNLCQNRPSRPLAPGAEANRPVGSRTGTAPDPHGGAAAALPARSGWLPASGAAAAQLLRLPLDSVRFLQAMAEDGVEARPVRIGANPPEGHVLFRSLSD